MTKTNKKNAVPVSVEYVPVYINGRVKYYNVHVKYIGDLSLNTESRESALELREKSPLAFNSDPMNHRMLTPVLREDVIIPKRYHITGFKYDSTKNISDIQYSWRNGLFGHGAERAWQFKIKMQALITVNENIK